MQEWIPGVGALDLTAVAAGYGTCWPGTWDGPTVTKLIGGDGRGEVVDFPAIGRPAGPAEVKQKSPLAELVGRGRLP